MNLVFPSHESFELSFKVGIAGTSALPQSVSVVLERAGRAISFKATQVAEQWQAIIENPGTLFSIGDTVNVNVNVIVNNRLFVPLKTQASIGESRVAMTAQELAAIQAAAQEFSEEVVAEDKPDVIVPPSTPIKIVPYKVTMIDESASKLKSIFAEPTTKKSAPVVIQPITIAPMKSKLKEQLKKSVKKEKIVKEQITVRSTPVKVSLFKDFDTSFTINHKDSVVKETVSQPVKESGSLFKLKRINTVYK